MPASVGMTTGSIGLENSSNRGQVAQMRKFLRNFRNERGFRPSCALIALSPMSRGLRWAVQQFVTIALRSNCGTGSVNRTVVYSIQIGGANVTVRTRRPTLLRVRPDAACNEQKPSDLAVLRHIDRACFLLSHIRATTVRRHQKQFIHF